MQSVSRKIMSAIEAVLYIASMTDERPVRSSEICKYQGLKLRYLEGIMQALVHSGILKGLRGPKGGYLLARDKSRILLSDIYDSVLLLEDNNEDKKKESQLNQVIMMPLKIDIDKKIREYMSSISIYDLSNKVKEVGLVAQTDESFDI